MTLPTEVPMTFGDSRGGLTGDVIGPLYCFRRFCLDKARVIALSVVHNCFALLNGLSGFSMDAVIRAYGSAQFISYETTGGWFFWTYKTAG